MVTDTIPKWRRVTGWVLSGILSLMFLPSAFFKIAQPKGFIEEWSKTYPAGSAMPLGVIELTMFVLYLIPKTRYLGGLLMLAYLGGAVATHVVTRHKVGAPPTRHQVGPHYLLICEPDDESHSGR